MVSLGDLCFANQLDATRVEGSHIRAKDQFHIGDDTHNEIRMYHYGSILYYHYVQDIECSNVTSYTGSSTVSVTLNFTPTVKQWSTGDSIHLSVVSIDSSTASPASGAASYEDLSGTHITVNSATSAASNMITFTLDSAVTTGQVLSTNMFLLLRIHRFKYLDMSKEDATWQSATALPGTGSGNSLTLGHKTGVVPLSALHDDSAFPVIHTS